VTSSRGDTRVKSIKVTKVTVISKKGRQLWKKINRGDTGELGDGDD